MLLAFLIFFLTDPEKALTSMLYAIFQTIITLVMRFYAIFQTILHWCWSNLTFLTIPESFWKNKIREK